MQKAVIFFLLSLFFLTGCEEELEPGKNSNKTTDTMPPIIVLDGNKMDTAYLYAPYTDRGARVYDDLDGLPDCDDFTPVSDISGTVNTKLPGTYFIYYNAKDPRGYSLASVTRTVCVVENAASFLNGNYDVACTCTALTRGLPEPVITSSNYTATAASGSVNNYFELTMLRIGPEYITPVTFLKDQCIEVGYFSPDYHFSSSGSGTVSATKNSFTINTRFYQYAPSITNVCKNVFTKQLVIK